MMCFLRVKLILLLKNKGDLIILQLVPLNGNFNSPNAACSVMLSALMLSCWKSASVQKVMEVFGRKRWCIRPTSNTGEDCLLKKLDRSSQVDQSIPFIPNPITPPLRTGTRIGPTSDSFRGMCKFLKYIDYILCYIHIFFRSWKRSEKESSMAFYFKFKFRLLDND
jgi:hypothetical protein